MRNGVRAVASADNWVQDPDNGSSGPGIPPDLENQEILENYLAPRNPYPSKLERYERFCVF